MEKENVSKDVGMLLRSFGKIFKQWGLEEPSGKVLGFLLFKSAPVTQREIEEGTSYSRGLVSRSLKKLRKLGLVLVTKKGKEFYYSTNVSMTDLFDKLTKRFLETEIKPILTGLSESLNCIRDTTVKRNVRKMISEYRRLSKGILALPKLMEEVTEHK